MKIKKSSATQSIYFILIYVEKKIINSVIYLFVFIFVLIRQNTGQPTKSSEIFNYFE